MEDIIFKRPKLHLFVCINDRSNRPGNMTPSCSPRIKSEDVREVKRWILEKGLTTKVYCTKSKCLGFCNPKGSVAVAYPRGRFVKGIQTSEDLKQIIVEEISI